MPDSGELLANGEKIFSRDNMNLAFKRVKANIRIHPKSVAKFNDKIRVITSRSNAMSMETRYLKLKQVTVGWVNYFKIANYAYGNPHFL